MKIKKILLLGLVAASLLASCKKNNDNNTAAGLGFKAITENNNGDSRTYLDGVDVKWMEGDSIMVANASGEQQVFKLAGGASTMNGDFYDANVAEAFYTPDYVALYPAKNAAGVANTIDADGIATFTLPSTQAITATGTFANKAMPMVAHSGTETLPFKNVLGGLVIPLVGDGLHVSKVVLTSLETTDKLWGVYTADCNSDDPAPTYVSGGSNQLTLSCDVTLDPATPNDFIFMVPPGTLSKGFKVEVFEGTTKLYEKTVDWSATPEPDFIPRSVLRKVNSSLEVICPCSLGPAGFTVGMDGDTPRRVFFAPGNLQWSATNGGTTATTHAVAGGGTAAGTWRFASNQWDYIGNAAGNNTAEADRPTQAAWIDLFGWGTSGYHYSGDSYNRNYQPWASSTIKWYYTYNYYAYGPSTNMTDPNLVGTSANYDWGVYNAIYNPKTNTTDPAGTWRTLTDDEWVYVINTRTTCSGVRYAKATVNNVPGLIIVPDNWEWHTYILARPNTTNVAFTVNTISSAEWTNIFEPAGCAFLPAAGRRYGSKVEFVVGHWGGATGGYWSATKSNIYSACILYFESGDVSPRSGSDRLNGESVRLVRSAE